MPSDHASAPLPPPPPPSHLPSSGPEAAPGRAQGRVRPVPVVPLPYGGDYTPEQWPREVWPHDVQLMREAGVTMVTVGVFAWSALEPADGRFEFGWLDEVVGLLADAGIAVDLATPNAAPPPWLVEEHPGTALVGRDGRRVGVGSRGHFCPTSQVYRHRSRRIAGELARRYGAHDALALWHVGNEYHAECFCRGCDAAFRTWLRARHGDLATLNERWGTAVWGQRYTDWSQVHLPGPVRGRVNPARDLDFARFTSHVQLELFTAERDLLHELAPGVPVTTNFFSRMKLLDYQRWAQEVDVVAYDSYPDPADPGSLVDAAMHYDLVRAAGGGRGWLLLEQAAGAVSQWRVNHRRPPGLVRLGSYQALAHGAESVMFFQWRASRCGQEKFHSAMLPHAGTAARSWGEVRDLGRELPRARPVAGSRTVARVALVWDWQNWWAVEGCYHPDNTFSYHRTLLEHYTPLWHANVAVDVVTLDHDLDPYAVLVVPNQYLMTRQQQEALQRFCTRGGHAVVSYFSGVVDAWDRVHTGPQPGALHPQIGAQVLEHCPLPEGVQVPVQAVPGQDLLPVGVFAHARRWQDDLVPDDATVVARYTADTPDVPGHVDRLQGAAVVERAVGAGRCLYLGTTLDPHGMRDLIGAVLRRAGVAPAHPVPDGVQVRERVDGRDRYLFVLNPGPAEVGVPLHRDGHDLLTGRCLVAGDVLTLGPRGVAVLHDVH